METIEKVNVKQIREDLKKLSENQKWLKNQRKTVKKDCSRKESDPNDIEPWEATYKHQINREKLRLMYAAYGLMRGKSFSKTENKFPEESHPLNEYKEKIDKIISEYTKEKE